MPSTGLPHCHVITPGDHYSPRTGSAVPTVVHGLCSAAPPDSPRDSVVVAAGTYPDRYDSAEILEYRQHLRRLPAQRYLDVAAGRLGLPRPGAALDWRATVVDQAQWPPSVVFAHNGPQLIRWIDADRHRPVLYAHNELLRTYGRRELDTALAAADRIVCVSDFLAQRYLDLLPPGLGQRVRVAVNGVDTEQFHPGAGRADDRGELTVLFLGRTIADKAPHVLLEAVARTGRSDIRVVVLGSDGFDPNAPLTEYEQSLRRLAGDCAGPVEFVAVAPRQQVPQLMRDADVLVIPSAWDDPCPLTIGEGMASGLPVVASAVGGIPQQLGDAGILVPPGDPSALAEVLVSLAEDPALRADYAARARARALEHDWAWTRAQLQTALQS